MHLATYILHHACHALAKPFPRDTGCLAFDPMNLLQTSG